MIAVRRISLTLTESAHCELRHHLFPGDGKEAVAFVLCSLRDGAERTRLLGTQVRPVPHDACEHRTHNTVTWPTGVITNTLEEAHRRSSVVVKVHSHPGGKPSFSGHDDRADRNLFPSLYGWVERAPVHASAVMLPDGSMFGRAVDTEGNFSPLDHINVAGDDLRYWRPTTMIDGVAEYGMRVAQAFGAGTYQTLRQLKIGVIGCSGTGNPLANMLARNCVGSLVLVDPDRVEEKNLNRLLNATADDARLGRFKVDILSRAIAEMGLGTRVEAHAKNLLDPDVVRSVAECDIVFGCVDTVFGRHLLNRIASFYLIPYFDVGVKLMADGLGNVDQVCGSVHYIKPGGSSLVSRGVYTLEQVRAEERKRTDPDGYANELRQGYLVGVAEDRPAVASVNMLATSMAVNEMLFRIHGGREDPNCEFAVQRFMLTWGLFENQGHGEPCPVFAKLVGRGDSPLLLDMPALDDGLAAA